MSALGMQQFCAKSQAVGMCAPTRSTAPGTGVLARAAPSPTSMETSLSGPGQAAEARTASARGGPVASPSVPSTSYSSSPDSIKAFLEAELPRVFTEGVSPGRVLSSCCIC